MAVCRSGAVLGPDLGQKAREIEIARRADLSTRCTWAQSNLEHEDPVVAREALRELSAVLDEALKAVRE